MRLCSALELLERLPRYQAVVCMNPKGHTSVDLETAEPASSRRSLIGAAGAAGLVGAAAALIGTSRVSAAPNVPTDADVVGLTAAGRLELAARDLYESAAEQLSGVDAELASVVSKNHGAYAQSIAGTTGTSANERDEVVFNALQSLFATSDAQAFARAARDLENAAIATHTELLGGYESLDAQELTASIITIEARHATVFTSMAGFAGNLDDMLSPAASALDLSGGAA